MWLTPDRIRRLRDYETVVKERQELRNECDQLRIQLEAARRSGGLAPHGSSRVSSRIALPRDLFPGGAVPAIKIVDVGAQRLADEDHAYQPLVDVGATMIIGFEPLSDAAEARSAAEPNVVMLTHFIGDGTKRTFHINAFDATSSLLPSNIGFLNRFESLATMCATVKTTEVDTTRLDDIPQVEDCDFLKLDVQGGELDVLMGASKLLAQVVVVHCEVEFSPVYVDQPLFGAIDSHLRAQGFELIDIVNAGYSTVKGLPRPVSRSQLLWGEAIYMRRPETLATLNDEKILKAAIIAHVNYGMYDVAASFLAMLDSKQGGDIAKRYGETIVRQPFATDALPNP